MDHEHIYDWSAQRAGAGITVMGKTLDGQPRRVTGCVVFLHAGRVIAQRDSERFVLALGREQ